MGLHLVAWGQTEQQSLCLSATPKTSPLQELAIVQNDYASHGYPTQDNDPESVVPKKGHIRT